MFILLLQKQYVSTYIGSYMSNTNLTREIIASTNNTITISFITNKQISNNYLMNIQVFGSQYLDSKYAVLCGYGQYWHDIYRTQADLSLSLCREPSLDQTEAYILARTQGENWPTVIQRQFNESKNHNKDDCEFMFYANFYNQTTDSSNVPVDYKVINNISNTINVIQGLIISQDCRISMVINAKLYRPTYQKKTLSLVLLIQLIILPIICIIKVYVKNTGYNNIIFTQHQNYSIYFNFDIIIQGIIMICMSTELVFVSFTQLYFLKVYLFVSILILIDVVILQSELCFQFSKLLCSYRNIQFLYLKHKFYTFIVILTTVIIQIIGIKLLPAEFILITILLLIVKNLLRLIKSFYYEQQNLQSHQIYLIINFVTCVLYDTSFFLTIDIIVGKDNIQRKQPLNFSFIPICILSAVLLLLSCIVQFTIIFKKTKNISEIAIIKSTLPYKYIKELIPSVYKLNQHYIAVPYNYIIESVNYGCLQCHNPYHNHSEYFGQQNLFTFKNIQLPTNSQCFLLISEQQLNSATCAICLDNLELHSANNFYYDLEGYIQEETICIKSKDLSANAFHQTQYSEFEDEIPTIPYFQLPNFNDCENEVNSKKFADDVDHFTLPNFDDFECNGEIQLPIFALPNFNFINSSELSHNQYPILEDKIIITNLPKGKSNNIIITKCKHIFHKFCLSQWVQAGNPQCPIDRQLLSE
ncbi:RING finger and transmembrane domain-containing protein [Spironucleus salmonicida]|uniref:RING finger and transmembrane domain-containing protein n=1 Tax=Spironucleus salmonicida TaxID=348837 RepID=V6LKN3_9EUKA|nr:RING finger and transmembrane domain-containing protein [Spironucleus salmonicida]|eukprot:EST45180.1 RING finger and transmembrane domain-containing protein [Spironucleus salmonicida]